MKLSMWQAGSSHSGWNQSTILARILPCGIPGPGRYPQRGLTFGKRKNQFIKKGAQFNLILDHFFSRGVSDTLLETILVMPSTLPPYRLIMKQIEPTQWQITWIRRLGPTA